MEPSEAVGRIARDLILRAADDWLQGIDFADLARHSNLSDVWDARDLCIGVCARLIFDDILVPGDIEDGFVPWQGEKPDLIARLIEGWLSQDIREVNLGDIAWFALTSRGEAIAQDLISGESRSW